MKKRKLIAIIFSKINDNYANLIEGLVSELNENDCDSVIFSIFSEREDETDHQKGQEEIYKYLNFEHIDGVIFVDISFWCDRIKKNILNILNQKCKVPILTIGSQDYNKKNINNFYLNSERHFEELVDHIIEVHNLKKIYCLTGQKENKYAQDRAKGYINSMNKHNLHIDDSYIFYGDFWKEYPLELARKIVNREIDFPEAVVCASDVMATALIEELEKNNINVPKDIVVTGFDLINDSFFNTNVLTTYELPITEFGTECVKSLLKLINNEQCEKIIDLNGKLIINNTCGCNKIDLEFINKIKLQIQVKQKYTFMIETSNMTERLITSCEVNDIIYAIDCMTYLINNYNRYFLCLKYDYFNTASKKYNSDKMILMLDKNEFNEVKKYIVFDMDTMLPAIFENSENPSNYFFTPLNFNSEFFGYSVVKFRDSKTIIDDIYKQWNNNVVYALKFLKVNNKKEFDIDLNLETMPKWFSDLIAEMNLKENFILGLPKMIELAHISQEHLNRIFRKYLNMTPTEFINKKRIDYSIELMLNNHENITEISYMCGFNNLSHFYHIFKKQFHCSPKQFIKKIE